MHSLNLAVARSLMGPNGQSMALRDARVRGLPYVNVKGQPVIQVFTGKRNDKGQPMVREHIVSNASLRHEEALRIDAEVLASYRQRAGVMELFKSSGLVHPVGSLGVLISAWERSSEITDAQVTLDGESLAEGDNQGFQLDGVPIPIIQKPFRISERALLASRGNGGGLDVTTGIEAAVAVARAGEDMLLSGSPSIGKVDGYSIYGLTNHPNRNLATISDWSDTGVAGTTILAEILALVQAAEQDRKYGPFALLIPNTYNFRFYEDFKSNSDKTLMQRILEDSRIKAVQVCDRMTTGQVVLVELDRSTVDLAVASDVTTIQWASLSGWTNYFQVYMAGAPRIKTDYDGRSGIVHASVGS